MSDDATPSEDEIFDELTGKYHAITILYNESESFPVIDLGDVPPQVAIAVMEQAVKCLFECIPGPVIKYNGNVIYTETYLPELDFDDDEEDDEDGTPT